MRFKHIELVNQTVINRYETYHDLSDNAYAKGLSCLDNAQYFTCQQALHDLFVNAFLMHPTLMQELVLYHENHDGHKITACI